MQFNASKKYKLLTRGHFENEINKKLQYIGSTI